MNEELKHKIYGTPISEWPVLEANELNDNGVGLWTIVPAGRRGYGLEGHALIDFIRISIHELLKRGAKPVADAADGIHYWRVEKKYGDRSEDIAEGVIKDWLAAGAKDPEWGEYWFALPHTYDEKKKNMTSV